MIARPVLSQAEPGFIVISQNWPMSHKMSHKNPTKVPQLFFLEMSEEMDIIIRNLDPKIIRTIEQMAEEKNLSRNTFLVHMLEEMTSMQTFTEMESRYKMLLEKCLSVIENNTLALQKISVGEEENQAPSDWR